MYSLAHNTLHQGQVFAEIIDHLFELFCGVRRIRVFLVECPCQLHESLLPGLDGSLGLLVAESSLEEGLRAVVSETLLRLVSCRDEKEEGLEVGAQLIEVVVLALRLA